MVTAPLSGYGHASYAASLSEFGTPRQLPRCGGWILERPVQRSTMRDAMGCYPLFSCHDWPALEADLAEVRGLVALSLVTDPFGDYDEAGLRRSFGDLVHPFKQHFVCEIGRPWEAIASRHHRYYARKALDRVTIERCDDPKRFLDDWITLYEGLIVRHQLTGLKAFSRAAFDAQFRVPGIVMLRASVDGETIGAHLWYRQGDVMQSHLAASSERGYELMAPYAIHAFAIGAFAGEARWLNLGGAAGLGEDAGLTRFKSGWATGARTAFFCGRIFDRPAYDRLAAREGAADDDYFPAYRRNELA